MSECRMIVSFSVRDGKISDDSNSMKYPEDLRELCAQYFGIADGFMAEVADEEDAPRERSLDALLSFCRASSVPVYGRGRIKRLEDVKKLIYAGCACAILDRNMPSNVQMEQEAQERFGKDHIAFAEDGAGSIVFPDSGSYETRILNIAEWPADKLAALRKSMQESGAVFKDRGAVFRWEDFKKGSDGLLTVVVQEEATDQVLMVAYMNEEAYNMTVSTGRMTYYSRSRKSLWIKGETSSHYQYVRSLYADCDMDTLLAKVVQIGPACHTGSHSCFFREDFTAETAASSAKPEEVLRKDFETILDRQRNPVSGSYTNYLFDKGLDKMLKKLGEEATEIIIAAKNPNPIETVYETADFLYHLMVVMAQKGLTWDDVTDELIRRQKTD